jgi:hypothetical protein
VSLNGGFGSIIFHMAIPGSMKSATYVPEVLNFRNPSSNYFQLSAFLAGTLEVHFPVTGSDDRRYAHIVSVAQRFGCARLNSGLSFGQRQ